MIKVTWNYYDITKNEENDKLLSDLREQLDLFESVLEGNPDSTVGFNIKIFKSNVDTLMAKLQNRKGRSAFTSRD